MTMRPLNLAVSWSDDEGFVRMTMTQLYPAVVSPRTLERQVWGADDARSIPGMARGLALYGSLLGQMSLDAVTLGPAPVADVPRPRLLEQPDLDLDRPTFVAVQVEDYLLHGNAAHLVTARDWAGRVAAVKWFPAHQWTVTSEGGRKRWWLAGESVDPDDVVHVQRGADPVHPWRGMGVVEQHVRTLDRVAMQEASERGALSSGQVPSVAVIAPQQNLTEDEMDNAALAWSEKFSGPVRRPAFLPAGTEVVPLSWSPNDQQATLARQMSLTDVANILNLDAYWLGAPGSSHTYRSPGPLFLALLRTSLAGVLSPFEQVWSQSWLPRSRRVRFDREVVLADDMGTTVKFLAAGMAARLFTQNEARARVGLPPVEGGDEFSDPAVAPALAETDPDDPDEEPKEGEES